LPPAWKILRGLKLQRQERRYLILSQLGGMRYPDEDGAAFSASHFIRQIEETMAIDALERTTKQIVLTGRTTPCSRLAP